MSAAAHPVAYDCDCAQHHMRSKKFYDLHGNVVSIGWTCCACGSKYLVPHRKPSALRRLCAWLWQPLTH